MLQTNTNRRYMAANVFNIVAAQINFLALANVYCYNSITLYIHHNIG